MVQTGAAPGDVVSARPRRGDRLAAPRRGIVLHTSGDDECVVWFRSMGGLGAAGAVQLLPLVDVTARTHVTRLAPHVITAVYRECAGFPAAVQLRRVLARHLLGAG